MNYRWRNLMAQMARRGEVTEAFSPTALAAREIAVGQARNNRRDCLLIGQ